MNNETADTPAVISFNQKLSTNITANIPDEVNADKRILQNSKHLYCFKYMSTCFS